MNLQAIREAVAARLDTVSGARAFPHPLEQPPTGNAVAVVVYPGSPYVEFQEAFAKGLAQVNLVVSPYVQLVNPRSSWDLFDRLCSSGPAEIGSMIDALMGSDRTLGGVVADLVVDDVVNVQAVTTEPNVRYLTGEINVRLYVRRN